MKNIRKIPINLIAVFGAACLYLTSCGTLGGIGDEVYFPLPKANVRKAFDSLFSDHPEYKIPAAWKKYDTWSADGYDFLESKILYFKSTPQEMYYVTFIDDGVNATDHKTGIGIRAVFDGNPSGKWMLSKDLNGKEEKRIGKRFEDEIVSKLEKYTNSKTWKE